MVYIIFLINRTYVFEFLFRRIAFIFFTNNEHMFLFFYQNNEHMFCIGLIGEVKLIVFKQKNLILKKFFEDPKNVELYELYQSNPSQELKEKIDSNFRKYYFSVRLLAYFLKAIHYEAMNLDQKTRKYQQANQLVLNKEFDDTEVSMIDLIGDTNTETEISSIYLEDYVCDPKLYKAIQNLSEKQKKVLYLIFVKDLQLSEIAQILNVSIQNVSKTKNVAISKLKKEFAE